MTKTAEAGKGYRLLRTGDTIQAGDEYLGYGMDWQAYDCWYGLKWNERNFHASRRKLPTPPTHPGYGYRFLKAGEKLMPGDTVWATAGDYIPVLGIGNTIGDPPPLLYRRGLVKAGHTLLSLTDTMVKGDLIYYKDTSLDGKPSMLVDGYAGCKVEDMAGVNTGSGLVAGIFRPTEPTCEEGYRWLKEGETLQLGDQFNWGDQHEPDWRATDMKPGTKVFKGSVSKFEYRRPLAPPEEKACEEAYLGAVFYTEREAHRRGWKAALEFAGYAGPVAE